MADEYFDFFGEEFLEQVDILGNFDEMNTFDRFFWYYSTRIVIFYSYHFLFFIFFTILKKFLMHAFRRLSLLNLQVEKDLKAQICRWM